MCIKINSINNRIKKAALKIGVALLVAATVAIGQTKSVASVKIGDLTWTKQNVNINTKTNSWCFAHNTSNCAKFGKLYTHEAAKGVCKSLGAKWRLPTNEDWDNLMSAAGGEKVVEEFGDVYYKDAGKKLKSKAGWDKRAGGSSGDGTDDFGFSAVSSGRYISPGYFDDGMNGTWWSATEGEDGNVYYRTVNYSHDHVYEATIEGVHGFSVRCVSQ